MIKIKILFFATIRQLTGLSSLDLSLKDNITIRELRKHLLECYPQLSSATDKMIISRNQEFSIDDETIFDGDEIALFPPVSGGANSEFQIISKISPEIIEIKDLISALTKDTIGAACSFTGIVRGKSERGRHFITSELEYDAYIPMAEGKIRQIAQEIHVRWPEVRGVAIVQRIGLLKVGEPSVHIVCVSSHRDQGIFQAVEYAINRLKEIVPVWKKEISIDGEAWVEGEYIPQKSDQSSML